MPAEAGATQSDIVLLVNPNTNTATTAMMRGLAAEELTAARLDVVGIQAAGGPEMLTDPESLRQSEGYVLAAVREFLAGPRGSRVAAVIVAAIGDPGRAELDRRLRQPVVGIGEASILAAAADRRIYAMATSTPLLAPSLEELVRFHGQQERFRGVHLTTSGPLKLAADPEAQFQEMRDAVLKAVKLGAEAVIIAGGPLSATARRLRHEGLAEIVEPIPSACRLVVERLAR